MLVTRVQEQLRVVDCRDDLPGRIDVALVDEVRIVVGAMNLDRHGVRPGPERPLPTDGEARVEQERPAGAGPRLGELLGNRHAERKAGIDQLGRQAVGSADAALPERIEALGVDERHALVDRVERSTIEQVRHMDNVAGRTQLVGECADAGRDALGVVEEQNLGHGDLQGSRDIVD